MTHICLSIAGSDPSGGAGLQADLKTFHQHGVYGAAAVTLITVQNTLGVSQVHCLDPDLVAAQVRAVLTDLPVAVIKTGALGSGAIAEAVAGVIREFPSTLIVDPVMVSKHGAPLLAPEQVQQVAQALFPLARLVTPNLDEAQILIGRKLETLEQVRQACQDLSERWGCAFLIKGGHGTGEKSTDVLWENQQCLEVSGVRITTVHTHGTGCTYASAIAARMALGNDLSLAVQGARGWLQRAIEASPGLGHGQGPVQHLTPLGTMG